MKPFLGAKLKYAYASSYDGAFTIVDVDNYSLTTNDIGLDVAKDANGNLVPYISYLSGNQVAKIAYPVYADSVTNSAVTGSGVTNGYYNGNWEISCIPMSGYSTVNKYSAKTVAATSAAVDLTPKYDTICVGIHKNWTSGTVGAITKKDTKINISNDDADSNYSTTIGGNGTKNPALAYTIVGEGDLTDTLQFAQMK